MALQQIEKLILNSISVPLCRSMESVCRPAITRTAEGQYKLATELASDICNVTCVDRSLNPKFLRELVKKAKGCKNYKEKCTIIKDELLKAMGYKNPEAVKLTFVKATSDDDSIAAFKQLLGEIEISKRVSTEQCISAIRHELEHMSQMVKLYKTKGKEAMAQAIISYRKLNKVKTSENVEDILKQMNISFYEAMAKETSVANFDAEKYHKALCEYKFYDGSFESGYLYCNNLLEKDAFAVGKKVLSALGKDSTSYPETVAQNYKTLVKLLKSNGVHKDWYETVLEDLVVLARVKELETPANLKRFARILRNGQYGIKNTDEDIQWSVKILKKISEDRFVNKIKQKPYQQIEAWLREGKCMVQDVLSGL